MTASETPARIAEHRIGQVLIRWTYVAVALLAVGVGLLFGTGQSPLSGGPNLDLTRLLSTLAALEPAGLLWFGLMAVIGAPIGRVLLASVAYGRQRDWTMVGIGIAIVGVVAVGVILAGTATV